MKKNDAILIVGAGPTGLALANDLARRKVPFKVIDSKPGPSRDSKGLALNISSQYGLRLIGLHTSVGGNGMPISRLNLYWKGQRFSSINFSHLPTGINSLITQPQAITEQELLNALEASGHQVCWGCKLMDVQETCNAVQVRYVTSEQTVIDEHFLYVAGCDGKYSHVRKCLDTSFAGIDYPMHFVLGDFCVDPGMVANQVHYYVYEDTFFILVPIAAGIWRIVVKYDGVIPEEPVSTQHITQIIARHFGEHFNPGEPLWISRAPFYNRVAGQLKSKRLFIAGDAAHLFSPIGGTGMNTGIQDALNLGWKLAAVYHGISRAELLDSYEHERLPAIKEAASLSDLSTRLITRKLVDHPVLDKLAPKLINKHFLKYVAPALHSGIAQKIALPATHLTDNAASNLGQFHRELFYLLDSLPTTTIVSNSPITFWCFISHECLATHGFETHTLQNLRHILLRYPGCTLIYATSTPNEYLQQLAPTRELFVAENTLHAAVNSQKDVVLVRPDGLVFYESDLHNTTHLIDAINSNLYFSSTTDSARTEAFYEEVI